MSAQAKGLLVTAAIAYAAIILYHKGMLPLGKGPKLVDPKVTEAGG